MRALLVWLDVNDGNMEEGSLRCDANVSVRTTGSSTLGTKTEVKNLNSFRFVQKALEYEFERQVEVLGSGGRIVQETRQSPFLELGVSPRGTVSLRRAAQANAFLEGRNYLVPDDIKRTAVAALSHRVMLKSLNGESETEKSGKIIQEILERVTVPL